MSNQTAGGKALAGILGAVAAGAAALAPAPALAIEPDLKALERAPIVPDEDLAHMRGRFIARNRVVHFGVQMVSEWQTGFGQTLSGGVGLGVDTSSGRPSLSSYETEAFISGSGDSDPDLAGGNGSRQVIVSDQGSGNARGVVQTIQVGGDRNRLSNQAGFNVRTEGGNASRPKGTIGSPSAQVSDPETGSRVSVGRSDNRLELTLEAPAHGEIRQTLASGLGLHQNARILTDLNQVQNRFALSVRMEELPVSLRSAQSVGQAVRTLRDLQSLN